MTTALLITLVLVGLAIFGVLMMRFTQRYEPRLAPEAPPALADPYELRFWQDLREESSPFSHWVFHLANGDVWRGRYSYHRYRDGADIYSALPRDRHDLFSAWQRRIEFQEPSLMARHGLQLVTWSQHDEGYRLTLLDGTHWRGRAGRWSLESMPRGLQLEPLVRIHRALDRHLRKIQTLESPPGVNQHSCGACRLTQVSIPGGICRWCREAQRA